MPGILALVMKIKSICEFLKLLSKFYIDLFSSKCFMAKQIIADLCNKGTFSVIKVHPMNIKISLLSVVIWLIFIT